MSRLRRLLGRRSDPTPPIPVGEPETAAPAEPMWRPGVVFLEEAPEAYRQRLLDEICAEVSGAAEARALIEVEIGREPAPDARRHMESHAVRYLQSYALMPEGPGRLVDVGGPSIHNIPLTRLKGWEIDTVEILAIDYESDPLPYADESRDGVLLCEVIEHFVRDPLFCFIEINRILKPGGVLLVTTPNASSWFSVYQALQHLQPNRWSVYSGDPAKARNHLHAHEYLVSDLTALLEAGGFTVEELVTRDYGVHAPYWPIPVYDQSNRGETIFCLARKLTPPRKRFTPPLYLEDVDFPESE